MHPRTRAGSRTWDRDSAATGQGERIGPRSLLAVTTFGVSGPRRYGAVRETTSRRARPVRAAGKPSSPFDGRRLSELK